MTEDGINIALTAEELELLKALAWNVGESSLTQFARRQLMNALGAGNLSSQGRAKARRIGQDLRRLHDELKGFLAEASPTTDELSSPSSRQENSEANGAWADTAAEPTVETTFASPTRFSFGRMTPPRSGSLFPGYHRSSAHAPSDGDDDLEEMAGKAFAISPRLGTFEPASSSMSTQSFAPANDESEAVLHSEQSIVEPESQLGAGFRQVQESPSIVDSSVVTNSQLASRSYSVADAGSESQFQPASGANSVTDSGLATESQTASRSYSADNSNSVTESDHASGSRPVANSISLPESDPTSDTLPSDADGLAPSEPSPGNSFVIPKIDVPGLEPESALRFEGDPLVDLLDQELLKLVGVKHPADAWAAKEDPQNRADEEAEALKQYGPDEPMQRKEEALPDPSSRLDSGTDSSSGMERVPDSSSRIEPVPDLSSRRESLPDSSSRMQSLPDRSSQTESHFDHSSKIDMPQTTTVENAIQSNQPALDNLHSGGTSFAATEPKASFGQSLAFYSRQEGGSLADQLLESAGQAPTLDNAEMHQSLSDELVDWVQDLAPQSEVPASNASSFTPGVQDETPATVSEEKSASQDPPPHASNSLFLSDPEDAGILSVEENPSITQTLPSREEKSSNTQTLSSREEKPSNNQTLSSREQNPSNNQTLSSGASAVTASEVDDGDLSSTGADAENADTTKDSTVLPRPPKIKPVEISGNSPPRKRRS